MKVSVIIPVYNAEKYLEQCLESLLNQTLKEIEIICVDDGSEDRSVEIIEKFSEKDCRISLLRQKNSYAGVARNNGLNASTGKYVIFLDADDFFEPDMLLSMYNKIESDHAEICLCNAKNYNEKTGEIKAVKHYLNVDFLPDKTPFSAEEIRLRIFNAINPAPWTKLFKREFIIENGFRFQPLKKTNDLFFVYSSLACAERITYINEAFVNYRVDNETSLQGKTSEFNEDFYVSLYALKKELQKKGLFAKFEQSFANRALSTSFYVLDKITDKENYIIIADKLRNSYLYHLSVFSHTRGYFYKKADYVRLIDFMEGSSAELWDEAHNVTVCESSKIDINEWKCPFEIKTEGKVKVSVIIPVYNVEDYLKECIDSVINNSLKDIEIICVNDGSTDSSGEILAEYEKSDSRVSVINKTNGGLSSARNAGITQAKGEYILFLDSDDYIEPRAIEYLYAEAKKDDLDQLFFCAKTFHEFGVETDYDSSYNRKAEYNGVMTGREMFIIMSQNAEYKPSVCLQLIRKDLLTKNNISFIEGLIYEDNPFTILCLFYAKRVRYADIDLYNRRLRADSIMTGSAGIKSSYNYYSVIKNIERIATENNFGSDPEFYEALLVQLKRSCFLSCNYASEAEEEQLKSFILSLDEKNGMDYYFYIKIAMNHRKDIKILRRTIKDIKEKALMDKYKNQCERAIERAIEEEKARKQELERLEAERVAAEKRAAYERTFKGRIKRILRRILKL